MSTELLVILTLVEIVALVAALALFVILITLRLRSIANSLGHLSGVVIRTIQGDVCLVGAGAAILSRQLNGIAGLLPAIAEKAESLPPKQTQARPSQQAPAPAPGTGWQPAVARTTR
jgi:hypothetical protein